MTVPTGRKQVAAFGTGYLTTRILRDGPAYVWCRAPGPARTGGFTPVPPAVRDALAALPAEGAGIVLGEEATEGPGDGDGTGGAGAAERRYRVGSAYSLGHVLGNHQAAPHQWAALPRLMHQAGRTLRRVHERLPAATVADPPRGTRRLAGWLAGRAGPGGAGRLHREARSRLGAHRLERAAQWCAAFDSPDERGVFLLGGPGLASVVPDPAGAGCLILAGEELARGPAAYDLGWTLGELAEFRLLHFARGGPAVEELAAHCAEAGGALLRGYAGAGGPGGTGADRDATARAAVLRMLTHAHDYAAFVDWTDQLTQYLDLLADLIDHPATAVGDLAHEPTGHRPATHEPEEQ
ncbi:hypothetical protein [Streptomyces sp. NPDC127066]|uniref:hypothetical protein n=1 Tax=Streptomyces sp. NPDC127066 TaxID=3347125 RepID=UPI003656CF46